MSALASPSLWTRWYQEARALARLGMPIILSQLAFVLMGLVDTVMAGWASPLEQAVVGMGVAIWLPVFLALMAIVQALSPIIAQHVGAARQTAIVFDTQQAVMLGALLGVLPCLMLPWVLPMLLAFDTPLVLAQKTELFLQGIAFGLPAALMFRALSFYAAGLGVTKPTMVISWIGLAFNVALNAVLIPGHLGLPALGGAACGWATGLGMWLSLGLMIWHVRQAPVFAPWRLGRPWPSMQWASIRTILTLGLPMGLAQMAEVSAFAGIALLIAPLGAVTVAAHQVALNFAAAIFMVPLGLSIALSIRVGQHVGANDLTRARFSAWSGVVLACGLALIFMPFIMGARSWIVAGYSPDPEVQATAATLLLMAATWQVVDATQVCANGALRGYHITLAPMVWMLAAFWLLAIPLGHHWAQSGWPALGLAPQGVFGYWAGLIVGLATVGFALAWMLHRVTNAHLLPRHSN